MDRSESVDVAVLLSTYNGARFVEQQISSLLENRTGFTLHWLDDHSSDQTRDIVRNVTKTAKIPLKEWHHAEHQGVPRVFFHLLERAEADIYLFCDQDDIWQPGKIDATVSTLLPDVKVPQLCFSDPMAFKSNRPEHAYRMLDVIGTKLNVALQESHVFMCVVGYGHTMGFTRALRDIFMKHKEIAREYAFMHDMWMYAIGTASGIVHMLTDAPTTLFRWHAASWSGQISSWRGTGVGYLTMTWKQHQEHRIGISRHAQGFILASPTLPVGLKLDRLLESARLLTELPRRHSLADLTRLLRRGVLWPSTRLTVKLATVCLLSEAIL